MTDQTTFDPTEQGRKRDGLHTPSTIAEMIGPDGCQRAAWLMYRKLVPAAPKFHGVLGTAYHTGVEAALAALQQGAAAEPDELRPLMLAAADELLLQQAGEIGQWPWLGSQADGPDRWACADDLWVQVGWAIDNWLLAPLRGGKQATAWAGKSLMQRIAELDIVGVEVPFAAPVDGVALPFGGTIDLIAVDRKQQMAVMIDHKTAGSWSRWKQDDLSGPKVWQAEQYLFALDHLDLDLPAWRTFEWHVVVKRELRSRVENARLLSWQADPNLAYRLMERGRAADRVDADGRYLPNPAGAFCGTCPFRRDCREGDQPLAGPVDQVEAYLNAA